MEEASDRAAFRSTGAEQRADWLRDLFPNFRWQLTFAGSRYACEVASLASFVLKPVVGGFRAFFREVDIAFKLGFVFVTARTFRGSKSVDRLEPVTGVV